MVVWQEAGDAEMGRPGAEMGCPGAEMSCPREMGRPGKMGRPGAEMGCPRDGGTSPPCSSSFRSQKSLPQLPEHCPGPVEEPALDLSHTPSLTLSAFADLFAATVCTFPSLSYEYLAALSDCRTVSWTSRSSMRVIVCW